MCTFAKIQRVLVFIVGRNISKAKESGVSRVRDPVRLRQVRRKIITRVDAIWPCMAVMTSCTRWGHAHRIAGHAFPSHLKSELEVSKALSISVTAHKSHARNIALDSLAHSPRAFPQHMTHAL